MSELLQQPPEGPRDVQAALMDELSLGVTFRSAQTIQREECGAAFQFFASEDFKPVPMSRLFSYVVDYLGDCAIDFPSEFAEAQRNEFVAYLNTASKIRSVTWLLHHLDVTGIRAHYRACQQRFVEDVTKNIKARSEYFRGKRQFSKERLRHEERVAIFKSDVIPVFRSQLLSRYSIGEMTGLLTEFNRRNGEGRRILLKKLFSLMPATELYAQLNASRSLNPTRNIQPQDFWNVEHARVAAAYSHVFVARDRGLIDLLNSRSEIPRIQGCHLLGGVDQLTRFIDELQDASGSSV